MVVTDTLSEMFEQQVARHPGRTALVTATRTLTYAELNRDADRVASAVCERLGAGNAPVGLFMDQDSPFMAAMLGVLKAGKIFSPLDPADPASRLEGALDSLAPHLVLTTSESRHAAEAIVDSDRLLCVDEIEGEPGGTLVVTPPAPDDLAWITWTSGSTGRPKGIAQSHRVAVLMAREYGRLAQITPVDRLTFLHPSLTWDIFGAWLHGAGLYRYDVRSRGIAGLPDWLKTHRITLYRSFPTTWRALVAQPDYDLDLPDLRLVKLGGEKITAADVTMFRARFAPTCRLLVVYGSNEAGLVTATYIDPDANVSNPVSIGRPLDDVDVRLFDGGIEIDEAEASGEIGVASPQLFQGYWRDPERTHAALRTNVPGSRSAVFMTGDLAERHADGTFAFVGRVDDQVKVAGQRIELGEVEGALRAHPGVLAAAAGTYTGSDGDPHLAAWIVPRDPAPGDDELRRHLRNYLPQWLIPDRFVQMDALPVTGNGKIDRRALPQPGRPNGRRVSGSTPATPDEALVGQLFAEVLALSEVAPNDNFFELGGASLAAFRVLARIQTRCGVSITPREFFDAATVAAVAAIVAARRLGSTSPPGDSGAGDPGAMTEPGRNRSPTS